MRQSERWGREQKRLFTDKFILGAGWRRYRCNETGSVGTECPNSYGAGGQ